VGGDPVPVMPNLSVRGVTRLRAAWVTLAAVSAAAGWAWSRAQVAIVDEPLFRDAGDALLHGRLAEVYAYPIVQAGPLELLWVRLVTALDAVSAGLHLTALGVVGVPGVTLATGYAVRRLRAALDLPRAAAVELGVAALTLVWGVGAAFAFSGHPAQVVVPVAWVAAGVLGRRGRPVAAGAVVGLAAGWETWAVLGAAVLLLGPADGDRPEPGRAAPRRAWPDVLRAAAALTAVVGLLYLPFVAAGRFRMLDIRWPVSPQSLVADAVPALVAEGFPWWARAVQAACAVAAAAAVALALGSRAGTGPDAVWLVPLVAAAVRLVLDPVLYPYYWTAPLVLALAGVAVSRPRTAAGVAVVVTCAWQAWPWATTWPGTAFVTLPLCAACAALARRAPRDAAARADPSRRAT
jgi:hypothetical protein